MAGRKSDFVKDLGAAVCGVLVGNLYRCSECRDTYVIDSVEPNRFGGDLPTVRAFDLTGGYSLTLRASCVAGKLKRARSLTEGELENYQKYLADREVKKRKIRIKPGAASVRLAG